VSQLSLRNIHKEFSTNNGKSRWKALDGINMSVEPGKIVGLLGPSGCGKSTLLNIISGLDTDFQGSMEVQGKSIAEQKANGFRIAYVFQESRLLPWRTVRENIQFALEAAKFPRPEWDQRIDRVLGLVELSDFGHFYPQQLSGGMQQRASIARAFAIEPDILLMDEPFSALDEMTARRLRASLLNIWEDFRTTILFVSHNPFESTFLADRIMVMGKGPCGRIYEEMDLEDIPRPRSYDDAALFETSKRVVGALRKYAGHQD
jgi:NitT/TauT family transport system ATP-binding protein